MTGSLRKNLAFEDMVRRVAEAVWRLEPGEVQPAWYRADPILRELDGIARLPDVTHLLMVTTSTKLQKVREDVTKLNKAERQERKQTLLTKQWLITEKQLNAEHIQLARSKNVETLTLAHFRGRFFHGRDYITKRQNAAFGSSRNLRDGSISIPEDEYIELPMNLTQYDTNDNASSIKRESTDVQSIVNRVQDGEFVCLLGPFGAGKSLTTREIFLELAKLHLKDPATDVPLAINLREHWGAIYGDEVLERHARSIGFTPRETLTVAWRAGIIYLLFDGFDEVATQVIARTGDKRFMRRTRYEALQSVRDLITKTPSGVGILICGRDHYFDTIDEMRHALGLIGRKFSVIRIGEFTEEKAEIFLKRHASSFLLPDWLPRKPLLLGYLAHQALLDEVLSIDSSKGFGFVWDSFLRLVCEREAQHERAVMDPVTIRRVLERLACIARGTTAGNGPITGIDLAEAYYSETGDVAGEGVLMQLQRLPGLTPREQDPTARSFVDPDLLAALQGGAVARVVLESAPELAERKWISGLPRSGVQMASYLLGTQGFTSGAIISVVERFCQDGKSRPGYQQLAVDCLMVGIDLLTEGRHLDGRGILLVGGNIVELDLEDCVIKGAIIRDCIVDEMFVGEGLANSSIKFEGCAFLRINGAPSDSALPRDMFSNCEFGEFDDASTNAAILRLGVSPGLKALMTVLRKLYLQAGGGRKIAALKRGIPSGGPVYSAIDPVIRLLQSEGMVAVTAQVAHPVRRHTTRAREILSAGALSNDPLVEQAKSMS